jgi:hypothetical protein
MRLLQSTTIILFSVLTSYAMAETYKCTDAQGKISYTNTECQTGTSKQEVENKTTVIDRSEERLFVEKEMARAKEKIVELKENDPEIAERMQQTATNLEKLKQADSLIHTAISTRERLWLAAIILIAVAVVFLFISRRFKKANKPLKERDLPIPR